MQNVDEAFVRMKKHINQLKDGWDSPEPINLAVKFMFRA